MTNRKSHPANRHRGEISITLNERAYVLVPTYQNLAAVEDACNAGILDVARRLGGGDGRISDLAHILAAVADPPLSTEEAGEALSHGNIVAVTSAVAEFLAQALLGGDEGKAQAAKGA